MQEAIINRAVAPGNESRREHEVFDYNNVDYRQFWEQTDRRYEDEVERIALRRLTRDMAGSCLEIGAGYGRLVDEYAHRCSRVLLTDCTSKMMDWARARAADLGLANVECRTCDLYELVRLGERWDNAVCVRVMHHVEDVPAFLEQVRLVLQDGGLFVFEYANKRNLLEILRWCLRRPNLRPFDREPSRRGEGVFYNFHPDWMRQLLEESGFAVEEELTVSLFRNRWLKRIFGHRLLAGAERWLQKPLAWLYPAPSTFVRARKIK